MTPAIKYPPELTQIVEYLSKPDSAIQFSRETHIAEISQIQSIHRYPRGDHRQGLVLNVAEKGASEASQIILDIKYAQPSTDQLCECIYGAGSLSGTRVLVHTGVVDDVDYENLLNFAYGHYTDIVDLQVRAGWNSFGAFVWVVQSDGRNDRLIDLWRKNEAELRDRFAGYELELEYLPGALTRFTVKISDLPLGWLLGAH